MQLVVVENKLSPGILSPTELNTLVETLELYAKDINHSPWVEHGYCDPIEVKLLPKGDKFPKGAYNLILLDEISMEGALGYHEDEDGGKIPVSYVPVKEIREDDASVAEVATHELSEMAVDPWVEGNDIRTVKNGDIEYIVEIADPLQECSYKVSNGQSVANFVWPRWFGLAQTRTNLCQRSLPMLGTTPFIAAQFEIAKTGYISIKEPNEEWKQIFGSTREKLPKWASRLPRIHGDIK